MYRIPWCVVMMSLSDRSRLKKKGEKKVTYASTEEEMSGLANFLSKNT
jgi:hypothetical protein